jgi:beta-glucanase (GH16 family)
MKYAILILFAALCLLSCAQEADWTLVWSDDFDYSGLPDSTKWTYEEGYIRNRELQYYTANRLENARVEDGMLIIETRKDDFEGHPITSASITTRGKASWNRGRIEVRAKLPSCLGTWPAIWMLGDSFGQVRWPDCGEIDIMENVGFEPNVIHANVHTKSYNHAIGTNKGDKITVTPPNDNFHIYAIEWFDDRIDFFVDDSLYFTFANEGTGAAEWPFDDPHYLLLNTAFGGSWGGREGVDDTALPVQYYIDYVRVYQK